MKIDGGHIRPEELNDWIDSGKSPEEIFAEHPHLQSCQRCGMMLVDLTRIDRALRTLPLPETRQSFTMDVMSEIGLRSDGDVLGRMVGWGRAVLVVLAATSCAAGVSLLLAASSGSHGNPASPVDRLLSTVGFEVQEGIHWLLAHLGTIIGVRSFVWGALAVACAVILGVLDHALSRWAGERIRTGG